MGDRVFTALKKPAGQALDQDLIYLDLFKTNVVLDYRGSRSRGNRSETRPETQEDGTTVDVESSTSDSDVDDKLGLNGNYRFLEGYELRLNADVGRATRSRVREAARFVSSRVGTRANRT